MSQGYVSENLDDLSVGDTVTIVDYFDADTVSDEENEEAVILRLRSASPVKFGEPLLVKHIELPFVIMELMGKTEITRFSLDVRVCALKKVSPRYIEVFLNKGDKECQEHI